jgi:hypothetical protein
MAFGSFLSGDLLTTYGWNTVLALSFVPLALAILGLLGSALASGRATPAKRDQRLEGGFNMIDAPQQKLSSHLVEPGHKRTGMVLRAVRTPADHD